jgi:hypothetical protein
MGKTWLNRNGGINPNKKKNKKRKKEEEMEVLP